MGTGAFDFPVEIDRAARIKKVVDDANSGGALLLGFVSRLTDADAVAAAEQSEKAARSAATGV